MKEIIKLVLNDMKDSQLNISSEAARETVATLISAALKTKGEYKEFKLSEIEYEKEREKWICNLCGGNTFEVDYDYLGSGTNHLGCELNEVRP